MLSSSRSRKTSFYTYHNHNRSSNNSKMSACVSEAVGAVTASTCRIGWSACIGTSSSSRRRRSGCSSIEGSTCMSSRSGKSCSSSSWYLLHRRVCIEQNVHLPCMSTIKSTTCVCLCVCVGEEGGGGSRARSFPVMCEMLLRAMALSEYQTLCMHETRFESIHTVRARDHIHTNTHAHTHSHAQ